MSDEAVVVDNDEWTREEYDAYAATNPRMPFAPTGASPLSENGYITGVVASVIRDDLEKSFDFPIPEGELTLERKTFAPTGATPLTENGYDVNKERTMDESTEKPKAIGVTDTCKAIRLGKAYCRWAGINSLLVMTIRFPLPDECKSCVPFIKDEEKFVYNVEEAIEHDPDGVFCDVLIDLHDKHPAKLNICVNNTKVTLLMPEAVYDELMKYFENNTDD